jgi:chemotaxis protein MotB
VNPATVAAQIKSTQKAAVEAEVEKLKKARAELIAALRKAGVPKAATFRFDQRGLVISIATDNVLFHSGSAALEDQGRTILNTLAPTLRRLPNQLSIDGHTNSIPIHTAQFPSNWELSGERASGVLRYLNSRDAIPFKRMSFTGFADTQPRLPASDPNSVNINRRVEIVVLARVDDSAGAAITELGNDATS